MAEIINSVGAIIIPVVAIVASAVVLLAAIKNRFRFHAHVKAGTAEAEICGGEDNSSEDHANLIK